MPPEKTAEEIAAEEKEKTRRILGLTSWDNTFDNFKVLKGTDEAFNLFIEISTLKTTWRHLLCYGTAGNGKSHLCEALSIELYKQGLMVRVWDWGDLIRNWKLMMRDNSQRYDLAFRKFRQIPFMIIDDVGMGTIGSTYEFSELEDIMRYRYKENLYTVMTTNLKLEELPTRVTSRFRDREKGRIVINEGSDYRRKKE